MLANLGKHRYIFAGPGVEYLFSLAFLKLLLVRRLLSDALVQSHTLSDHRQLLLLGLLVVVGRWRNPKSDKALLFVPIEQHTLHYFN